MKSCEVYLVRDVTLSVCTSTTVAGFQVVTQPMFKNKADEGVEALTKSILQAIEASQTGLPIPTETKSILKPLIDLAGYSSWKKFAAEAVVCSVLQLPNKIQVIPYASDNKGNFLEQNLDAIDVQSSNSSDIGGIVFSVLCKSAAK